MHAFATFFFLLLFPITNASPQRHLFPRQSKRQAIQWGACDKSLFKEAYATALDESGYQCARLPVPLYYSKNASAISNNTLLLDLIKLPAKNQPSQGSIITNYGGPGQDGLNNIITYQSLTQPIFGGDHDIISFDPR